MPDTYPLASFVPAWVVVLLCFVNLGMGIAIGYMLAHIEANMGDDDDDF